MNHAAASAPPLAASAMPLPPAYSPAYSRAYWPAYWLGTPAMLGCLLGVALPLQQPALSAPLVYGLLLLAGCALAGLALLPGAGRARCTAAPGRLRHDDLRTRRYHSHSRRTCFSV